MKMFPGNNDRLAVLKIVTIYVVFGTLWIFLSDNVLVWMVRDPAIIVRITVFKGVLFILLTSILLYKLFRRYVDQLAISRQRAVENEERFKTIYNFANDAVFIHDAATGAILDVNQTMCDLYGYPHDEAITLTVNDISLGEPPYSQAEALGWLRQAASGMPQLFEWLCKTKSGGLFWTEVNMRYATIGGEGRIIVVVRDITKRKQAVEEIKKMNSFLQSRAQELHEANRELEAFNYTLSHDIRSHISRISIAGQILKDSRANLNNPDADFVVDVVGDSCQAMETLVENILALSRVSHGEMDRCRVDLSSLVGSIAAELQAAEPERQVDFDIAPGVSAYCDANLIRIALENLLKNACKYTGRCQRGLVEFGMFEEHGKKVIFVRDNGLGFDMNDAGKLFKPFQRLPNAKDFPGTGIGLATVQRIIQRHGGDVWGEGAEGNGATFCFSLPD